MEQISNSRPKTQFGPVEGHAALVETLSDLKRHFIPNLQVNDETGYWDHRDPHQLAAAMGRNAELIDKVAAGIEAYPLSVEAAEDVDILTTRIQRIAKQVHATLGRSSPEADDATQSTWDSPEGLPANWPDVEARWDELYRTSAKRTLEMQRIIEEELCMGETTEKAVGKAFEKLWPVKERETDEQLQDEVLDSSDPLQKREWQRTDEEEEVSGETDPLLERATQLFLSLVGLLRSSANSRAETLMSHAADLCDGLSQVLPMPQPFDMDDDERGLAVVQLKRALRGAAYLQAAMYTVAEFDECEQSLPKTYRSDLEAIEGEIIDLLRQTRRQPPIQD